MWLIKCILAGWTLLAAAWWSYALWLVRQRVAAERRAAPLPNGHNGLSPVTVFKPLVALRSEAPSPELVSALESFVGQVNDGADLLFGVEQQDAAAWQPVFERWRQQYPDAHFAAVYQPRPTTFLNPRGSWLHALAPRARGKLWLWSDADIVAPPGTVTTLRRERAESQASLVTCPYVVRRTPASATWLEALFVNVEFYPGVLACHAWGTPSFAFGAGMLFAGDDFQHRLRWEELGGRIADDNLVGRRLIPVHISRVTLETLSTETRWHNAILHYLRRHKTVRWVRPGGYAAQIVILPVLGWLAMVAWQPTLWWSWAGLLATIAIETCAAARLCVLVGCQIRRHGWVLPAWSAGRALTWLACWLPWPVVFRSQRRIWWSLYHSSGVKL